MSKSYIATAIPYVNGAPHIGHAMDFLLGDVYRRYLMAGGGVVRMQAGTDEHGNKVYQKAIDAKLPAQQFVDQNAQAFKDFIRRLGVEYTDFIRTTDQDHMRRCQAIWEKLEPYIYKGSYEGWYCTGCEGFFTQTEYDENRGVCADHQKPYVKLNEENYYLKISEFKERIKLAISADEIRVVPEFRKKEMLNLLADMEDVSISRPAKQLSWGIPVPGDVSQTMYVWVDALTNYITVLGYPEEEIGDWWPAALQVIGKDIARFHLGIWPAILLGLGLPLPKAILIHGHITVDGAKMSKSVGNVIDPIEILDKYGTEPFRYYFLRHVPTTDDADFSWEKYESAYHELANDLGNLVQRLSTMCQKYGVSCALPELKYESAYRRQMEQLMFSQAFNTVWSLIQSINKQIDDDKPWELAKNNDRARLEQSLSGAATHLMQCAQMLRPFLPETAEKILEIFGAAEVAPPATTLFPKKI